MPIIRGDHRAEISFRFGRFVSFGLSITDGCNNILISRRIAKQFLTVAKRKNKKNKKKNSDRNDPKGRHSNVFTRLRATTFFINPITTLIHSEIETGREREKKKQKKEKRKKEKRGRKKISKTIHWMESLCRKPKWISNRDPVFRSIDPSIGRSSRGEIKRRPVVCQQTEKYDIQPFATFIVVAQTIGRFYKIGIGDDSERGEYRSLVRVPVETLPLCGLPPLIRSNHRPR